MGVAEPVIRFYLPPSLEEDTESIGDARAITMPAVFEAPVFEATVIDVSPLRPQLRAVPTSTPPPPPHAHTFSCAFWAAMVSLPLAHGVDENLAARAVMLATRAQQIGVTEPSITLTDDDGVRLTWFKDHYTMHADAIPRGVRWYFRKAEPGARSLQAEASGDDLPDEAWRQLKAAESSRG